jgi:hypothetical protein
VTAEPAVVRAGRKGREHAADPIDERYAADAWQAGALGVAAARGRGAVSFAGITQPWLREAVKRWARQRLATGCAFNTIRTAVLALQRFSGFLGCRPPVRHPEEIDRALLERYLAWLAPRPLAESTKELARLCLRGFLEDNRRHRWLAGSRPRPSSTRTSCAAGGGRCRGSSRSSSWASSSPTPRSPS